MPTGMYTASFGSFMGGDLDFVNDKVSALLIDVAQYAVDLENDATIDDIPEAAVISETLLTGKFIDGLSLYADDAVFQNVVAEDMPTVAVVVFFDAETTSGSKLFTYYDSDVSFSFEGDDVIISWSPSGILIGDLVVTV